MVVDGWVSLIEGDVGAMKDVSAEGWEDKAATTGVRTQYCKAARYAVQGA